MLHRPFSKFAAGRTPASPAGSPVVHLRAVPAAGSAVHTPGPESATGPGTPHLVPTTRAAALEAIFTALLATGWTIDQARQVVAVADAGMAELVATATIHARRLERAMPGIGA